jgi:hypothetical protein
MPTIIISDHCYVLYNPDTKIRQLMFQVINKTNWTQQAISYPTLKAKNPQELVTYFKENPNAYDACMNLISDQDQLENACNQNASSGPTNLKISTALNSRTEPIGKFLIVDGGSDTCSVGGQARVIDRLTDKVIGVTGFDKTSTLQNIKIGGAITACDLPDGSTTILLKVNEVLLLGKDGCSLLSIAQMHESQVNVDEKPDRHGGFPHIETEGSIIPLQLKHGLLTLPIGSPTDELHTCDMVQLTSEDPC